MRANEFFDGVLHLATVKQFLSKEDLVFLSQYLASSNQVSEVEEQRAEELQRRVAAGVMRYST